MKIVLLFAVLTTVRAVLTRGVLTPLNGQHLRVIWVKPYHLLSALIDKYNQFHDCN